MDKSSVEFARLKLLTSSQQRLICARNKDWTGLKQAEAAWALLLSDSLEKFGGDLESIAAQLQQDNDEVIEIVQQAQKSLLQERKATSKNLSQVKQYLK